MFWLKLKVRVLKQEEFLDLIEFMQIDDVRVYGIASGLEKNIYWATEKIPSCKFEQIDQIRRSSASVSANICEGFSRRSYPKDFIRFLCYALGSSDETKHHLSVMRYKKIIDEDSFLALSRKCKDLSIRTLNLIIHLKKKNNLH